MDLPGGASGKEPACHRRRHKRHEFDPWVGKIPWRNAWQPTPVFLPGGSHDRGAWWTTYSPYGRKGSDTTEATQHERRHNSSENSKTKASMLVPFQVKFRQVINLCHVVKHYYRDYTIENCLCQQGDEVLGGKCHGSRADGGSLDMHKYCSATSMPVEQHY